MTAEGGGNGCGESIPKHPLVCFVYTSKPS
jgi:hypothetical protein